MGSAEAELGIPSPSAPEGVAVLTIARFAIHLITDNTIHTVTDNLTCGVSLSWSVRAAPLSFWTAVNNVNGGVVFDAAVTLR